LVGNGPADLDAGSRASAVHATYNRTDLGQRAAIAKLIARFPRAKGEAVLKVVIERAHQINANPELCSYIRQLRLFGSMLDPSIPMVGDVDVAVELGRRKPSLGPNWPGPRLGRVEY
jgi:hypothetical protein